MCTVLLPPGGYPIAVNKYMSYHISEGKMRTSTETTAADLQGKNKTYFMRLQEILQIKQPRLFSAGISKRLNSAR